MNALLRPATLALVILALLLTGCAAAESAPSLSVVAEPGEYDVKIYTMDPDGTISIPEESVPLASAAELSPTHEGPVTKRQAEALAIQHASLTQDDVSFLFSKEDVEDGIDVIEVSFRSGTYSYEFEIDASTAEISSYEKEDIRKD